MRQISWLAILSLLIISCQPQAITPITIIDEEQTHTLSTDERIPANLMSEADITLSPNDVLLVDGLRFSSEEPLPSNAYTLQVRRAVTVKLILPEGCSL